MGGGGVHLHSFHSTISADLIRVLAAIFLCVRALAWQLPPKKSDTTNVQTVVAFTRVQPAFIMSVHDCCRCGVFDEEKVIRQRQEGFY